jgi:hypothetical protein
MKSNVVTLEELLGSLPDDQKTENVINRLKFWYEEEINRLNEHAKDAKEPSIGLSLFEPLPVNRSGNQHMMVFIPYMAKSWVDDLSKPVTTKEDQCSQNAGQWLYAGCVVV